MLQSLERGRRTEVDFMNGYVVKQGREKGVPKPSWSQGGFFYHCRTTGSSWGFWKVATKAGRAGARSGGSRVAPLVVRTVALKQLLVYD
jgi:hypothetical protein